MMMATKEAQPILRPWRPVAEWQATLPQASATTETLCREREVTTTPAKAARQSDDLSHPGAKARQVGAVLVGALVLLTGVQFGADQVLPTLLPDPLLALAAGAMQGATVLLCLLAVCNAVGKLQPLPEPHLCADSEQLANGMVLLLSLPGLGGVFLTVATTIDTVGPGALGWSAGVFCGLVALTTVATLMEVAADADPVPLRLYRWLSTGQHFSRS